MKRAELQKIKSEENLNSEGLNSMGYSVIELEHAFS